MKDRHTDKICRHIYKIFKCQIESDLNECQSPVLGKHTLSDTADEKKGSECQLAQPFWKAV